MKAKSREKTVKDAVVKVEDQKFDKKQILK
jgi:hypothetical protein